MKPSVQTERIRRYFKKYPFAKPKAAAAELGVSITAIYSARSAMRKKINVTPKRVKARMEAAKTAPEFGASNVDLVNSPPHYRVGGVETIDFIEAKNLNYNLGNAVKYITRADHKDNRVQDLEKARWYIEREILSAHVK
jgi:hypothetical protein